MRDMVIPPGGTAEIELLLDKDGNVVARRGRLIDAGNSPMNLSMHIYLLTVAIEKYRRTERRWRIISGILAGILGGISACIVPWMFHLL